MNNLTEFDLSRSLLEQVRPGDTATLDIPIVQTLVTRRLSIVAHVIRGKKDGPVLGILGNIHGDETGILPLFKDLVDDLNPADLAGTVVLVPVANPPAVGAFSRFTPEQHGNPDLHQVFPGNSKGNLTQKIAARITETILEPLDALIDFHSGGSGGRLQRRVDFDGSFGEETRTATLSLCRAFGTIMVHENKLARTASAWLNERGKPTVNVEIGGAYLSPNDAEKAESFAMKGIRSVMQHLGIVPGEPLKTPGQVLFTVGSRFEANPGVGGFLESHYQSMDDLDQIIEKGTVLGRVIDPYTLEVAEELVAPVTGRMFFSRYSGIVEAGTKAFAIAEEATSKWL